MEWAFFAMGVALCGIPLVISLALYRWIWKGRLTVSLVRCRKDWEGKPLSWKNLPEDRWYLIKHIGHEGFRGEEAIWYILLEFSLNKVILIDIPRDYKSSSPFMEGDMIQVSRTSDGEKFLRRERKTSLRVAEETKKIG